MAIHIFFFPPFFYHLRNISGNTFFTEVYVDNCSAVRFFSFNQNVKGSYFTHNRVDAHVYVLHTWREYFFDR